MPWQQLTHCGIKIPACETITHKSTKDGCESERIWEMGNIRCRLLQLSEIRLLIYDEGIQPCALLITLWDDERSELLTQFCKNWFGHEMLCQFKKNQSNYATKQFQYFSKQSNSLLKHIKKLLRFFSPQKWAGQKGRKEHCDNNKHTHTQNKTALCNHNKMCLINVQPLFYRPSISGCGLKPSLAAIAPLWHHQRALNP